MSDVITSPEQRDYTKEVQMIDHRIGAEIEDNREFEIRFDEINNSFTPLKREQWIEDMSKLLRKYNIIGKNEFTPEEEYRILEAIMTTSDFDHLG